MSRTPAHVDHTQTWWRDGIPLSLQTEGKVMVFYVIWAILPLLTSRQRKDRRLGPETWKKHPVPFSFLWQVEAPASIMPCPIFQESVSAALPTPRVPAAGSPAPCLPSASRNAWHHWAMCYGQNRQANENFAAKLPRSFILSSSSP